MRSRNFERIETLVEYTKYIGNQASDKMFKIQRLILIRGEPLWQCNNLTQRFEILFPNSFS